MGPKGPSSASWPRSRTARSRPSGARRSRRRSRRRPSSPPWLAEQQRAVTLARSAAAEVEAPAGLRARIEAQRPGRAARRKPRRLALAGAVAAAAIAVAVGVAVVHSGTSAQRFHAALAPTGLAPGATGKATLTKTTSGWRIKLDATGLPRLDAGRFYEAWLKKRRRRARPDRDVQRGAERDALGRGLTAAVHDADRDA